MMNFIQFLSKISTGELDSGSKISCCYFKNEYLEQKYSKSASPSPKGGKYDSYEISASRTEWMANSKIEPCILLSLEKNQCHTTLQKLADTQLRKIYMDLENLYQSIKSCNENPNNTEQMSFAIQKYQTFIIINNYTIMQNTKNIFLDEPVPFTKVNLNLYNMMLDIVCLLQIGSLNINN